MKTLREARDLCRACDQIFEEAHRQHITLARLADKAGLCEATVYRLDNLDTLYPRAQTVFALAKAVGMEFVLQAKKIRLSRKTA